MSAQATLLDVLNKAEVSTKKTTSRKRPLALANGEIIDLREKLKKATPEVVEAMRLHIIQLEDELAASQAPPAKRARTSATTSTAAETPSTSSNATKAEEKRSAATDKALQKKTKAHLKKIFNQLKKACKAADCKFQGKGPKIMKVDEILEPEEFDAIFRGKGILIQPTPTNKPNSSVTIITYVGDDAIKAVFGDELKPLKGDVWSIGGGLLFSKSRKFGQCDVEILMIEVSYSKNTSKVTLKFGVDQVGGGSHGYQGFGWVDEDW